MSYLTNKIGPHRFISLQGQIIPPAQTKSTDDRPGVDGTEFIVTGRKGRPFTLISVVDEESYRRACVLLTDYQRMIDDGAVEIVQGGVSGDENGFRVVVLDVEGMPQAIAGAVGNYLSTTRGGLLTARWQLVAVPN